MADEHRDPQKLAEAFLPADPKTTAKPVMIMLSGLPGTGKSHLGRLLAQRLEAVIVESDQIRKGIFPAPTYRASESELAHHVCRLVADRLLGQGANVIYDATNLNEPQRELIYHLADKHSARLVIVQTVAPEEIVRERLDRRMRHETDQDNSDASWAVYQAMKKDLGKYARFGRSFITIDTTEESETTVRRILRVMRKSAPRKC